MCVLETVQPVILHTSQLETEIQDNLLNLHTNQSRKKTRGIHLKLDNRMIQSESRDSFLNLDSLLSQDHLLNRDHFLNQDNRINQSEIRDRHMSQSKSRVINSTKTIRFVVLQTIISLFSTSRN